MRTRLKLKAGQRGTKKLLPEDGSKLVCVRYRYDLRKKKRCKTVEFIVEEKDWTPSATRLAGDALVGLRVEYPEVELRNRIKTAGGRRNPARKV